MCQEPLDVLDGCRSGSVFPVISIPILVALARHEAVGM
jgi:hypothetical protein